MCLSPLSTFEHKQFTYICKLEENIGELLGHLSTQCAAQEEIVKVQLDLSQRFLDDIDQRQVLMTSVVDLRAQLAATTTTLNERTSAHREDERRLERMRGHLGELHRQSRRLERALMGTVLALVLVVALLVFSW